MTNYIYKKHQNVCTECDAFSSSKTTKTFAQNMLFLLSKMCHGHREDWNHCIKVVGMASLWTSEHFIIHTSYLGALLLDKVQRRWTCAEYSSQQGGILLCKVTNPILACLLLHCCKICFGLFYFPLPSGEIRFVLFQDSWRMHSCV